MGAPNRFTESDRIKNGNIHIDDNLEPLDASDARDKSVYTLGSYFYFNKRESIQGIHNQFTHGNKVHFMLDSGVFTYRKKGGDVNIDKYINFLNANADLIEYAVTLDYPHESKEIVKNTDYIQARLDPRITLVPVIQTFLFNREEVEYTLQNYKFICLGTYNGKNKSIMYSKEVQDSLKDVYTLNKKYKRILHGLGRTRIEWLLSNPVDSSDSSAWARYMITGNTVIWKPEEKKVYSYVKEHRFLMMNHEEYYCTRFDITKEEYYSIIENPKNLYADTYPHNALCCMAYLLMQEEIRKKHPNYRYFFATSNGSNFSGLNKAAELYYQRKF